MQYYTYNLEVIIVIPLQIVIMNSSGIYGSYGNIILNEYSIKYIIPLSA